MTASVHIRAASSADAEPLARLSGQLGYAATAEDIARRFRDLQSRHAGAVLVAELDGEIAGWAEVSARYGLVHDPGAELAGLVVDERVRGAGIGRALLRAAEGWTREQGYARLVVRSNVVRERAHRFYRREGYAEQKRQAVFMKDIRAAGRTT